MAAAAVDDLEATSDRIDSCGLPVEQRLQIHLYANGLRKFVGGVNHWSNQTSRYIIGQPLVDTAPDVSRGRRLPPSGSRHVNEVRAPVRGPGRRCTRPLIQGNRSWSSHAQHQSVAGGDRAAGGKRTGRHRKGTVRLQRPHRALSRAPGRILLPDRRGRLAGLQPRNADHRGQAQNGIHGLGDLPVFDPSRPNLAMLRFVERRDADGIPDDNPQRPLYGLEHIRIVTRTLMPVFNLGIER